MSAAPSVTGRLDGRTRAARPVWAAVLVALATGAAPAALKINEVYYNVIPQGGYQYVELLNAGSTNCYLDGMILTDEASVGLEGVFRFPGTAGGTNFPVAPNARVIIAVDATADTALADWECYAGGLDFDHPGVSNLTKVAGTDDLGFFAGGDNCLLATGADTDLPIDPATVVDGVNFGDGGGELAPVAAGIADASPGVSAGSLLSIGRCPDGNDTDVGSTYDFTAGALSPDAPNNCLWPALRISDVSMPEGNSGIATAAFVVSLSAPYTGQVVVTIFTTNGSAQSGIDYGGTNGLQLVFAAGVTNLAFNVGIIGDLLVESDEDYSVRLANPTNATITRVAGLGEILDDDGLPNNFTSSFTRIVFGGGSVTTLWTAITGRAYQVQFRPAVASGTWSNLGSVVTAAQATVATVDVVGGGETQRIYRVLHMD